MPFLSECFQERNTPNTMRLASKNRPSTEGNTWLVPKPICITCCSMLHIRQKYRCLSLTHFCLISRKGTRAIFVAGAVTAPAKVHAEAAHDRDAQKHAASNHQAILRGKVKAAKALIAFWIVINWFLNQKSIVSIFWAFKFQGKDMLLSPKISKWQRSLCRNWGFYGFILLLRVQRAPSNGGNH